MKKTMELIKVIPVACLLYIFLSRHILVGQCKDKIQTGKNTSPPKSRNFKGSPPDSDSVLAKTNLTQEESKRLSNISQVLEKIEDRDLAEFKRIILDKNLEKSLSEDKDGKIHLNAPKCGENDSYRCHRVNKILENVNDNIDHLNDLLRKSSGSNLREKLRELDDSSEGGGKGSKSDGHGSFLLHYPITVGNWSELEDPTLIKCPSHHRNQIGHSGSDRRLDLDIIARRPRTSTFQTSVPGYICHGMRWTSSCNEMWYFVTYHDRAVTSITPNKLKCIQNIQAWKRGEHVKPYYPLEECNWNAETTKTVDYHMIIPYSLRVDPLSLQFEGEIFLDSQSCKPGDSLCFTDDNSKIWFPDDDDKLVATGHCPDESWDESSLTIHPEKMPNDWSNENTSWSQDYILKGILFGEKRVRRSCLLEFCGAMGLLFEDGEWWEISVYSADSKRESLTKLFLKEEGINRCNGTEERIGVAGKETDEKALLDAVLRKTGYEKCKAARYRLTENKHLRLDDLSYINPRDSVMWPAYRVRRQSEGSEKYFSLETAMSEYGMVQVTRSLQMLGQKCYGVENCSMIVGYNLGKEIRSDDWTPSGHPGVYVGINGLIRKDDENTSRIYYPPLSKEYESVFSDSGEMEDEAYIYKPEIKHKGNVNPKKDDEDSSEEEKKNKTPLDDLSDWWKKLKGEWKLIKGIIVSFLVFLGLYLIIKCCLKLRSVIKEKKIKKVVDEEKSLELKERRAEPNIYEEINETSRPRVRRGRNYFN
ncbi:glycoprotein [Rochambeau virus]|uniref:Glycoprotein n=1 Tax=Rochambeau virus TaxID=380435 RepID=A0A0D3R216_9RHAB|nr:glycoprotein [Rochambeau virus]AJR28500.1 glycoprotein [Rochambeau virus]